MSNIPDARPTAPQTITTAVLLMRIGAALSAASVVLTLVTFGAFKDDIAAQLNASNNTVTQAEIDTAVAVGISFVLFIGVVSVVLWLWMAWKNAQGRSWARAVASVLGGFNVVFTFFGFVGGQYMGLVLVLQTATLAIAIGALFLLWRPASTTFYEAVDAHRTTVVSS
ncbi:hypothetical protein [Aeromicrobium sp. CF3.5]|uniref:hypothetical protein n=1 Tax=Aeromicrobium sp. CF3.5 TaxID=3373078 RepID=UPI003EE8194C